jgi:hypothetical protein
MAAATYIRTSGITIVSATENYTMTDFDDIVKANGTGGAFTVTLPDATGVTGRVRSIKRTSALGVITVGTTGGQTIDGLATKLLSLQWATIQVISDGSNWLVLGII